MGIGIQICGLNGCGKSTLGKALAEALGFHFIDNEDLFFSKSNAEDPYSNPKSRDEVEKLLAKEVSEHENFVFAAVKGDYGADILPFYNYIVLIEVPRDIRLQRVHNRSFLKFGDRMLAGGDLYEQEEAFFRTVAARAEDSVESWAQTLTCPLIRVDGTKPIEENVRLIIEQIKRTPTAVGLKVKD